MIYYPNEYIEAVALTMIQDGMTEEAVAIELDLQYEEEKYENK